MPRITLQQQWDSLYNERLESVKKECLDRFFKENPKPEAVYECNNIGDILKREIVSFDVRPLVDGFKVHSPFVPTGKSPTTLNVEDLKNYIDCFSIGFTVSILYKTTFGTTGMPYSRSDSDKNLAFNEADLKTLADERRELYAPREGFSPCTYCRKQVPTESMVEHTIIGRDRKQVWNSWKGKYESKACLVTLRMKFCSGVCAGNEQMSREG